MQWHQFIFRSIGMWPRSVSFRIWLSASMTFRRRCEFRVVIKKEKQQKTQQHKHAIGSLFVGGGVYGGGDGMVAMTVVMVIMLIKVMTMMPMTTAMVAMILIVLVVAVMIMLFILMAMLTHISEVLTTSRTLASLTMMAMVMIMTMMDDKYKMPMSMLMFLATRGRVSRDPSSEGT